VLPKIIIAGVGIVAVAALVGCSPASVFTARNTVPGVAVRTQSTPEGSGDKGGSLFEPAGSDEARITAKTALAECGSQCEGTPNSIRLARLGAELGSQAGKLAWIIEYDDATDCALSGGPIPLPGSTPGPTVYVSTCTEYHLIDALEGGSVGTLQVQTR
jgi:hypothetical protein